jgi:hypothetical protein
MWHLPWATRSAPLNRLQASTAIDHQDRMMRGLVHGAILALPVWVTAGYLTFILR